MTDYLARLKALRAKTPIPHELTKLTKGGRVPSVGFVSDPTIGVLKSEEGGTTIQNAYPAALPKLTEGSPWIHPQLQHALARALFDDGRPEKTWLVDTTVRAQAPLLEQAPKGVDRTAWTGAVLGLSEAITATGRRVSRGYDEQPIITLKTKGD
jgi:hypothetical protein